MTVEEETTGNGTRFKEREEEELAGRSVATRHLLFFVLNFLLSTFQNSLCLDEIFRHESRCSRRYICLAENACVAL